VTYRRVLDWMTGFTDTLYIQLGATRNYSVIADLHTSQFTVTHALGFSYPGNDFLTVSLSLRITHEVFFSRPNYFLVIILQLPIPKTRLNSIPLLPCSYPGSWRLEPRPDSTLLYNHSARTTQETQPIVWKACLQRRCIATEVTRLLLAYSFPREYVHLVVA
jgi:hypothetical protein